MTEWLDLKENTEEKNRVTLNNISAYLKQLHKQPLQQPILMFLRVCGCKNILWEYCICNAETQIYTFSLIWLHIQTK